MNMLIYHLIIWYNAIRGELNICYENLKISLYRIDWHNIKQFIVYDLKFI